MELHVRGFAAVHVQLSCFALFESCISLMVKKFGKHDNDL